MATTDVTSITDVELIQVMGLGGNDKVNGQSGPDDTVSGGLGDNEILDDESEIDELFVFTEPENWLDGI